MPGLPMWSRMKRTFGHCRTSLIVLAISLVLWVKFDPREAGFQFNESLSWLPHYRIGYKMGVDGISVLFVLLSTVLTPVCILASWESI